MARFVRPDLEQAVAAAVGDDVGGRQAGWATLDHLAASEPDLLLDALTSHAVSWRGEGALATALVGAGVDLDDPRLREVLRVLRDTTAQPDEISEGVDDDWKDRSGRWLRGPQRAAAAALQERLVARWVSRGAVDALAALPVDEVRSVLFEVLEAPLDWQTRGRVVALLVQQGEHADDPRFASILEEVRFAAALGDGVVERDAYWTETTIWADQREAARSILRSIGDPITEGG